MYQIYEVEVDPTAFSAATGLVLPNQERLER